MEKLFDIAPYSSDYPNLMEALKAHDEADIIAHQRTNLLISKPVKHVLYELERRNREADYSELFTIIDIFNYGYILGKRAERAKKCGKT